MDATTFTQELLDKLETRFQHICQKFRKIEGDCWLFTGWNDGRYGSVAVNNLYGTQNDRVHRFAWIAANKRLPKKKMHISHTCENLLCFNPNHLVEQTAVESQRSKATRGTNKGRKSKLTAEQKDQVYKWYTDNKFSTQKLLAEHTSRTFGVDFTLANLKDFLRVKKNGARQRVKKEKKDLTENDVLTGFVNALSKAEFVQTEFKKKTIHCLVCKYAQKRKQVAITLPGQVTEYLQRVAFTVWHGDGKLSEAVNADGKRVEIDHLCHNTRCILPSHLEAVDGHVKKIRLSSGDLSSAVNDESARNLTCPKSDCEFSVGDPSKLASHIKSQHLTGMKRAR